VCGAGRRQVLKRAALDKEDRPLGGGGATWQPCPTITKGHPRLGLGLRGRRVRPQADSGTGFSGGRDARLPITAGGQPGRRSRRRTRSPWLIRMAGLVTVSMPNSMQRHSSLVTMIFAPWLYHLEAKWTSSRAPGGARCPAERCSFGRRSRQWWKCHRGEDRWNRRCPAGRGRSYGAASRRARTCMQKPGAQPMAGRLA